MRKSKLWTDGEPTGTHRKQNLLSDGNLVISFLSKGSRSPSLPIFSSFMLFLFYDVDSQYYP